MKLSAIPGLEGKRIEALSRRDSLDYFSLCNILGVEAEDEDLYSMGEMEMGMQRAATRKEIERSERIRQSYHKQSRDATFVTEVDNRGVNIDNIFLDTDPKIELLRDYGYFGLVTGERRTSTVLEDCNPARIGIVAKRLYYSAKQKPSSKD